MADEPTELDKRRASYVEQIIRHVLNGERYPDDDVRYLVDNLLREWGAEAYKEGRLSLADDIRKLVM